MSHLSQERQDSPSQFRVDPEHYLIQMMRRAMKPLRCRGLNIQLSGDVVSLTGNVDSWSDKQIAQESIREVSGARIIQNNLAVAPAM